MLTPSYIKEASQHWQCVLICWGDKYSNEHVNKLSEQIMLNDPNCVKTVLLTDAIRHGINPHVEQKLIPDFYLEPEMITSGCHAKLCMFEKNLLDASLPTIFIDLDTLVFGPLGRLLNDLKSEQNLMMIPGRGRFRVLRRFFAKVFGGRKFGRANSSVVVFYPKNWHTVSSVFRSKIENGVKLQGEYMIADDRFLAWYAQQNLQLVSTSDVVKFGTEFVLPKAWMSKLKGRLPGVEKRRSNLVAITFPGTSFEPSEVAKLKENKTLKDHRGRPLIWDDATIGTCKNKISSYYDTILYK